MPKENREKTATIYHNPRCSKSRQTLALLEDAHITIEIIDYQKNPPNLKTLKTIQEALGLSARDMMRQKEDIYKSLNLSAENNEQALLKAIADNPILLERPIVLYNGKAVIGRPPENVLAII